MTKTVMIYNMSSWSLSDEESDFFDNEFVEWDYTSIGKKDEVNDFDKWKLERLENRYYLVVIIDKEMMPLIEEFNCRIYNRTDKVITRQWVIENK